VRTTWNDSRTWITLVATLVLAMLSPAVALATPGGTSAGAGRCHRRCTDTTAPSVSIVAPTAGATVSGTLLVTGTAADNVGVTKVQVQVDGGQSQLAGGTTSWSASIDSTAFADGNHTVRARAADLAGNTATFTIQLTTSNAPSPPPDPTRLVTPEGLTIEVDPASGMTPAEVYQVVAANALQLPVVGPTLTIKVQSTYSSGLTAGASCCDANGHYYGFKATMYLKFGADQSFTIYPDKTVAHEYGHAWSLYWYYMKNQADWSSYLSARGIAGDSRLESSYAWTVKEIIAEDYRLLFGSQAAIDEAPQHMNSDIPDPRSVSGLSDFMLNSWATPS
jgi:hypothetical protein